MKKFFALTVIFALALAACEQPTNEINPGVTLPTLTIRNESSFDLTNVKFSGSDFKTTGFNDLLRTTQAVKQLAANDIGKTGYITFTRKNPDIESRIDCRTEEITITDVDYTFTFYDNITRVEEQGNPANKGTLAQITFLSQVTVENDGRTVLKNDTVNLEETVMNNLNENEFKLINSGTGKLLLTGNEPIKISDDTDGVFSVVQPSRSEIAPNASLPFKIKFTPKAVKTYTATVTITSNDKNSPYTFTINAAGTPRKPIAVVMYDNNKIHQNDPIDAGEEFITLSKSITVIIKNDGTEILTIEKTNISITGTDKDAFIKSTEPGDNVAAGFDTSFIIECKPVKEGVNQAVLTIPTNDNSRNPIVVNLRVTGKRGTPVLVLTQGTDTITNNTLTPVNFNNVNVGTNKPLVFTIKNNGNINLELTGETIIESSNTLFDIPTLPVKRIINPGETESFIIRYSPAVEHEDTATITILNNMDSMVFTFTVKGIGYVKRPQIVIQQNSSNVGYRSEYNYGNVGVGDNKDITFTIRNSGDANLSFIPVSGNCVSILDNSENHFVVLQQPSSSSEVVPNGTTTFVLRFIPTAIVTNYTATVQIKTNSRTNEDFAFSVKGNGYEKKPQITIKKDNTTINQNGEYDFGTVSLASGEAIEVTFTIGNSGEANLTIDTVNSNQINLVDNTAGHYSLVSQPPAGTTVSPGNTTSFTIRFKPKAVGTNIYSTVQMKTNSQTNSEFTIRVKGTCVRYLVGDTGPGGGKIFYISGNQYKEISPNLGSSTWANAITATKNYRGGNFTNWRLPDTNELVLADDYFPSGIYWSSEESSYNTSQAKCYEFSSGYPTIRYIHEYAKSNLFNVRAIREFSL